MANPIGNIEEFFLKIFKVTILLVMGLALVAIVALIPIAAVQYFQTAKEPPPPQAAPEKQISMEELKAFLIEQEKQKNNQNVAPKSRPGESAKVLRFYEEALALFRCSLTFSEASGRPVQDPQNDQVVLEVRALLEQDAESARRGDQYVRAAKAFACKVLSDPTIVALAKETKPEAIRVGAVFRPTLDFHRMAWDRIQTEKQEFEQREQNRVASARASEELRVGLAKVRAVNYLIAAGGAFAVFMLLALYLVAAKIENNLRDIKESVKANRPQLANF